MAETILQFIVAARRRLGSFPDVPGLSDPLAAVVEIVKANPDTPEARTLARITKAIWSDSGEFAETDLYSLDQRSLALVAALAEDRMQARYTEDEWKDSLEKIGDAHLEVDARTATRTERDSTGP